MRRYKKKGPVLQNSSLSGFLHRENRKKKARTRGVGKPNSPLLASKPSTQLDHTEKESAFTANALREGWFCFT